MILFNNGFDNLFDGFNEAFDNAKSIYAMKTDIVENDKAYLLSMDLPGVSKDNVSIEHNDGTITVSVKKAENDIKDGTYVSRERNEIYGSRSFELDGIDEDKIKAKFENGVLNIIVPKMTSKQEAKKFITIE